MTGRAQSDTKPCGQPNRDGTPCKKVVDADAEACVRHTEQAEQARTELKAAFLAEFDGTWGDAQAAAARVGLSRTMAYVWRDTDPEFAAEWDALRANCAAAYERTIAERFFDGVEEPVFHQGRIVGHVTKYVDAYGPFMLKALAPDKYRDRLSVSHGMTRDPGDEAEIVKLIATPGGFAALNAAIDQVVAGERIVDAEIVDDDGAA